MDLSNNRIAEIHNLAFRDVGNALKYLKMSNALYFTTLPNIAFHTLTSMEVLGTISSQFIIDLRIFYIEYLLHF